jgi:hypothetical protein
LHAAFKHYLTANTLVTRLLEELIEYEDMRVRKTEIEAVRKLLSVVSAVFFV